MSENKDIVFHSIVNGLNQGVEYTKGKLPEARKRRIWIAPLPDFHGDKIRALRKRLQLSQALFAAALGVSIKTVEAWESGRNKPSGSAQRILELLDRENHFLEKHNIISV
jgi:putative transcriptional regulator